MVQFPVMSEILRVKVESLILRPAEFPVSIIIISRGKVRYKIMISLVTRVHRVYTCSRYVRVHGM